TARRDPLHVFAAGSAAFGLGIGMVAVAPAFAVVLTGLALSGAGNGLFGTAEMLIYQRHLPNRLMGRVRAAAVSILNGSYALSMVCAGTLIHSLGVSGVFALGSAAGALATAVVVAAPPAPGPSRITSRIELPRSITALNAPCTEASGWSPSSRHGCTRAQTASPTCMADAISFTW